MTNVVHLRDYTRHKPELDPKQDKPAVVVALPGFRVMSDGQAEWGEPQAEKTESA